MLSFRADRYCAFLGLLMEIEEWKTIQHHKLPTQYAHFDFKVSLDDDCWAYISDPKKIAKHGFYPFIHYDIKSRKVKAGKKESPKIRSVYYAAHLDSWIYKYYAYLLNERYNVRVDHDGISSVAVAYRTDLKKSNIHFAHEAFNFIKSASPCYVMIGDFTDFFDSLDHSLLKQRICDLLSTDQLPDDYYAVFKNVTKFCFWELNDLLKLNNLGNKRKDHRALNRQVKVLSTSEFKANKQQIKPNPGKDKGVPQGSPISAVFANIYMLEADKIINEFVRSNNGFYMRYSDDFMIVLPGNSQIKFAEWYTWIVDEIALLTKQKLQPNKTRIYHVEGIKVENCTSQFIPGMKNGKDIIDFLGFSFNGSTIFLRDKTISKFYYRMYRKIKSIKYYDGRPKYARRLQKLRKDLFRLYTYKGTISYQKNHPQKFQNLSAKNKYRGNFLDYVSKAQKEFENSPIDLSTKNHMKKIRRKLKGK